MPAMTLKPDGLSVSGGWVANTGTIPDALYSDDGDTTYAEAGTDTETCTLTFSAPSVAEGSISSITSVQFLTYGRFPARGSGGEDVNFAYKVGASTGPAQTINYDNSAVHHARDGNVTTVAPGGGAWTYSNLEDVEMKLTKNTASSPDVRVGMVHLLVTYVSVAADTTIAPFFGTNF